MNKFFGLCERVATSKPFAALAGVVATASAFAEGEAAGGGGEITSALVTQYINSGKGEVVTILTTGAAIVGAFFIWALIKKALNRAK